MRAPKKGIRRNIIIVFLVCYIFTAFVGYLLISDHLMTSVNRLETINVENDLQRVQNSYNDQIAYLEMLAVDWSVKDDTYNFVQDHNETYVDKNMTLLGYANLDISMIILTDDNGHIIYGKYMESNSVVLSDIEPEIIERLQSLGLVNRANQGIITQGLILLENGPMLIASHPILTSNGRGPVRGNVIIGRFFDSSLIKKMSNNLNLSILQETIEQHGNSPVNSTLIEVNPNNAQQIVGSKVIPELGNQAAIKLTIVLQRDIHAIGDSAVRTTLVFMAVIVFISLLLLLLLITRLVLNRIGRLHRDVKSITDSGDVTQRVSDIKGQDEISELTDNINDMLGVLEDLHMKLTESNDNLESIVKRRTEDLIRTNLELISEKEKIAHIAYHDSLTGLPNGLYFNDSLNREISKAARTERPLVVFFLDLDGFKLVNDTLGHSAGDELLIKVSDRLKALLRKSDFIARIGGDEFVIYLSTAKSIGDLDIVAERILQSIAKPFSVNDQECFLTASIGISIYPTDGSLAQELIKNADLAMYRAKDNGRNQYCFCDQEMKDQVVEKMILSNQLWRALEKNELELYYQPQVDCKTEEILGFEALLRWHNAEQGLIMPGRFISLAEQTGAIITIGEWVLRTACQQCKIWQDRYNKELRIAVNVSVKQLQNRDIVDHIKKILDDTGLNAHYLEIEITENILLKEIDYVFETLRQIEELGICIAIDDFGTEYSSMNYLKTLPVNRIKIAMPFVQGLDTCEKDQAITKAIIILAKNLGLNVIAEGVETKRQHDFLTKKLCDAIQGYYFFRPMPANEMEAILSERKTRILPSSDRSAK